MLYRLRPHAPLEWTDFPGFQLYDEAVEAGADFDRLDWQTTTDRMFSQELLQIALRHGVPTATGIVLSARHTVDLGRSDELRVLGMAGEEAQAELRRSTGELMESLMPGWTEHGEQLDERVRQSMEAGAQEADEDLAEVLAAPVRPDLLEHWQHLGGTPPGPR